MPFYYDKLPNLTVRSPVLALILLLALAQPVQAQDDSVTLNLKEADISAVINTVSEVTGKNFIVDPRVRGKITIISSRPMDRNEVYQVFLSVLDVHGFSAIESGNVVKIVPDANAKQLAVPVTDEASRLGGDEVVTRVVQLENVSSSQLVPILRPLVPQQGHLAAYVPGNILIISDRASNVARMVNIIRRIDTPSSDEIEVVRLGHASASEVVRILNSMETERRQTRGDDSAADKASMLIADDRTNSVLIGGPESSRLRLHTIISHLDTPLQTEGNTQVYYLRYAKAAELVEVLTGVSSSIEEQQEEGAPAGGQRNLPVNLQADENTNALVITAPPDILRSLESVIKQLDVRRAQVHVEGIIAEVSSDFNAELGVQWIVDGSSRGSSPVGLTNFTTGSGGSIAEIGGALLTDQIPAFGTGLTLGFGRLDSGNINFAGLLRALQSDGATNILSTPSLVTLDNEEAEIIVGEEVPFVTGSFSTAGTVTSPANPFQTIQRQNVGLTLKVRPQINEGDAVKLEIEQKIDSIGTRGDAVDLVTNTRSIRTSIIVDDGQLVVLGGLIRDDVQDTQQKVPLLGDIPLIGRLFRFQSSSKEKTNLMVFLKPTILRDAGLMANITSGKYNYIRTMQMDAREAGVLMLPREESPLLPEFDDMLALPPAFE